MKISFVVCIWFPLRQLTENRIVGIFSNSSQGDAWLYFRTTRILNKIKIRFEKKKKYNVRDFINPKDRFFHKCMKVNVGRRSLLRFRVVSNEWLKFVARYPHVEFRTIIPCKCKRACAHDHNIIRFTSHTPMTLHNEVFKKK